MSTTTLSAAVKSARNTNNKSSNGSNHTPGAYNRAKNAFIVRMARHPEQVVRLAAVTDQDIPTKVLQSCLELEEDQVVLRSILMNPRIPEKAIVAFCSDTRCDMFDEDVELTDYLVARIEKIEDADK